MTFDPRLLSLMAGLMCVLMSAVLFVMHRSYPRTIHGLRHWSLAAGCWGLAGLLLSTRGLLPDLVSIVPTNVLSVGGALLFYLGQRRHTGLATRLPRPALLLGLLGVTAAQIWFTLVEPSFPARLAIQFILVEPLLIVHLMLLWKHERRSLGIVLAMTSVVYQILIWMFRLVSVLMGKAGELPYEPTIAQSIFLASAVFAVPLATIACVLVASEKLHAALDFISRRDPLTGILNRRALMESLETEVGRALRHGRALSLMMLDMDHFKQINDTHGHQKGDAVLVDFATRVGGLIRTSDTFGRYGGEEFVVILPETTATAATELGRRIHDAGALGTPLAWTVSIGVASLGDRDDPGRLLGRADAAVYQAKSAGRARTMLA